MIKSLIVAALMLIAFNAIAHGSSHPVRTAATGTFVPNDVATGVTVTNRFAYDKTGRMLFCTRASDYSSYYSTCTINGRNAWQLAENFVPSGRTYIGFQLMYASGDWYIALYYQ